MTRLTLIAITVCAIAIPTAAPTLYAAPHPPSNISSHPPEFFRDLLGGRVFVFAANGEPAAYYFSKDNRYVICWFDRAKQRFLRGYPGTWRIGTPASPSNLQETWTTPTGDTRHRRRVIIYTPNTGRFHTEAYFNATKQWKIGVDGWIQNSLPKALYENCPHLGLPHDLLIDDYQDTLSFDHMKANASPVKHHPGSDRRFPGATGLGASRGAPTLTPHQVATTFQSLHRKISVDTRGAHLVYYRLLDHTEVWHLDKNMSVINTGIMRLDPYASTFITDWQRTGGKTRFRFGYPIPVQPTKRLHPVFPMMHNVVSRQQPVPIPGPDGVEIDHVFESTGAVQAPGRTGAWKISQGKVEVTFGHRTHAYPWRVFANFADWKSS